MSTARITESISVQDYLAGESVANVKHEYVAGAVYAMVGATNAHNLVASNTLASLHAQLKGQSCRPFNSDTKIRIPMADHVRFYYPDVSVVCEANPLSDTFQDRPVLVVEVLSDSTRRLDDGEKRDAYLSLPSLMHYILLEQDIPAAVVYQRTDKRFERREYTGLDAHITLANLAASLPLADVYEGAFS